MERKVRRKRKEQEEGPRRGMDKKEGKQMGEIFQGLLVPSVYTRTTAVGECGHFQQTASVSTVNARQTSASARPLPTGRLAGKAQGPRPATNGTSERSHLLPILRGSFAGVAISAVLVMS